MGEGLKRAFAAAKATRKPKPKVTKLENKCDMCGAAFIMGCKRCPGCGQEFP